MNALACLVVLALVTLATPARADVIPPNREQCDNKRAGDSCLTESNIPGRCVDSTCERPRRPLEEGGLDDGGTYACRRCESVATTEGCRKGSSCSAGAGDLGSGVVLVAIVLPFLARRRKR